MVIENYDTNKKFLKSRVDQLDFQVTYIWSTKYNLLIARSYFFSDIQVPVRSFVLFQPLQRGGWWRFSSTPLVLCLRSPSTEAGKSRHPKQTFVLNDKLSPQGTTAKTFLIKRPTNRENISKLHSSYLLPNAQYARLSSLSVNIFIFTLLSRSRPIALSAYSFETAAVGLVAKLI